MLFDTTEIISGLKTYSDLVNLMRELETLEKSLYKTGDEGFDRVLETGVNKRLSEVIIGVLNGNDNEGNLKAREELLHEIIESVKGIKVFKIAIAVKPSKEMINKLHLWITDNIGAGIVIEIEIDPEIIAGARITYLGKYFDGTKNAEWNAVWDEIKSQI